MTNRLKSMFIGLYPMMLFAILGYAGWQAYATGAWVLWVGPALTAAPFAAFLTRVMVLRDVPRTSGTFPLLQATAWGGVALSGFWLARGAPGAGAALAIAGIGAAAFSTYALWYSRLGRAKSRQLAVGNKLPELTLVGPDGAAYSTKQLAGGPAVIFFYRGNWCPLCMAQIKEIAASYRELSELGAKVALVSPQPHENTVALAKRFDVDFVFLTDPKNRAAKLLDLEMKHGLPMGMQVFGYDSDTVLPTVIVLDREGVIRWVDETDNYRVRPEPTTFLPLVRELARAKPRLAA